MIGHLLLLKVCSVVLPPLLIWALVSGVPIWLRTLGALSLLPSVQALPFADTAADIQRHLPGISTEAAYMLLHTVYHDRAVIRLNALQAAQTTRPVYAWLTRLAEWSSDYIPFAPLEPTIKALRLSITAVARGLGLNVSSSPASAMRPDIRLLVPHYDNCQLCGNVLEQDRDVCEVWIATDTGFIEGNSASGRCQNCQTTHHADRYSTHLVNGETGSVLCRIYNPNSTHLSIGRNLWATRALATSLSLLRYSGHMSNETLAKFYNGRYPSPDIKLTPKQIWKLFVLHEAIKKCHSNKEELVTPAYTPIYQISKSVMSRFHPGKVVKVLPGALAHSCDECHHQHRTGFPEGLFKDGELDSETAATLDQDILVSYPACCNHYSLSSTTNLIIYRTHL